MTKSDKVLREITLRTLSEIHIPLALDEKKIRAMFRKNILKELGNLIKK